MSNPTCPAPGSFRTHCKKTWSRLKIGNGRRREVLDGQALRLFGRPSLKWTNAPKQVRLVFILQDTSLSQKLKSAMAPSEMPFMADSMCNTNTKLVPFEKE